MSANSLHWILLFLFFMTGCRDKPEKPPEMYRKMKACRKLIGDSALVVQTLRKGMNRHEREVIESERSRGLEACMRRHPDMPGICLDFSDRNTWQNSEELATVFCMTWPGELIACMQKQDLYSPACRRSLDEFQGTVESTPRSPGPQVSFSVELPSPARDMLVRPGGHIVLALPDQVVCYKNGQLAWIHLLTAGGSRWLLGIQADRVLTFDAQGSVIQLGVHDGQIAWKRELPGPKKGRSLALNAARDGDKIALGLDDGQILLLDPEACAAGKPDCLRKHPHVDIARLGTFRHWATTRDGVRLIVVGGELAGVDRNGDPLFRFQVDVDDYLGEPLALQDGSFVVATRSGHLFNLQPRSCRSPTPLHLVHGELPGDCVRWQARIEGLHPFQPVEVHPQKGVVVSAGPEGTLVLVKKAKIVFKTRAGVAGPVRFDGKETLYTYGDPPEIRAVSTADGSTRWRTALPKSQKATQPFLSVSDNQLVITYGNILAVIDLAQIKH